MSRRSGSQARPPALGRRPVGHKFSTSARIGVVIAACVAAFLITRAQLVTDAAVLPGPTEELIGLWETDDPRYLDRGFEIRLDAFHLHVGPDDIRAYPLRGVRAVAAGATGTDTEYELTYLTPDGENVHRMTVGGDGRGRLDRPDDIVWTRTSRS